MAEKIKFTRPELKRQRDALSRFERYLPMLKLKQQQLQVTIQGIQTRLEEAWQATLMARQKFEQYGSIMNDVAGVNVSKLAKCEEIKTSSMNIAGVQIPVFEETIFPEARYSLFSTPPWVDTALADLREINARQAREEILKRQNYLLDRELTKIIQRVNLFEKVKIPQARENIRRIRIQMGDEMTAAVGRAKIAKNKLTELQSQAD